MLKGIKNRFGHKTPNIEEQNPNSYQEGQESGVAPNSNGLKITVQIRKLILIILEGYKPKEAEILFSKIFQFLLWFTILLIVLIFSIGTKGFIKFLELANG